MGHKKTRLFVDAAIWRGRIGAKRWLWGPFLQRPPPGFLGMAAAVAALHLYEVFVYNVIVGEGGSREKE